MERGARWQAKRRWRAKSASARPGVSDAALVRSVVGCKDADEALAKLQAHWDAMEEDPEGEKPVLDELLCAEIIETALQRENHELVLSMYACMRTVSSIRPHARCKNGVLQWPGCTLSTVEQVMKGMCRALRVNDAIGVLNDVRRRGVPKGDEVPFGNIVRCPICPKLPLAVVKPQEGCTKVSCSGCRHEYELFSGDVVQVQSEVLGWQENLLLKGARMVGAWKDPHIEAIHEIVVKAPDASARSFRVATATADVPAQEGQRVTCIGAPINARKGKLYAARAPGKRAGEPMLLINHDLGKEVELLRPPPSGKTPGVPSWLVPVALLAAGGDAASSLIDPSLPLITAGATAAIVGSAVLGNAYLLPELKKLPAGAVSVSAARQQLLSQHDQLMGRLTEITEVASEDVRKLARYWQLQNKIKAVGDPGAYNTRTSILASARSGVEERLSKLLQLLDSYARLINMIEIEVELGDASTASIVSTARGIEEELLKLQEVEELQEDMQVQAQANDEIERLMRSTY